MESYKKDSRVLTVIATVIAHTNPSFPRFVPRKKLHHFRVLGGSIFIEV